MTFTSNSLTAKFNIDNDFERLLVVITAEHILLLIKYILAESIPDQPKWVKQILGYKQFKMERAMLKQMAATKEEKKLAYEYDDAKDSEKVDEASDYEES